MPNISFLRVAWRLGNIVFCYVSRGTNVKATKAYPKNTALDCAWRYVSRETVCKTSMFCVSHGGSVKSCFDMFRVGPMYKNQKLSKSTAFSVFCFAPPLFRQGP